MQSCQVRRLSSSRWGQKLSFLGSRSCSSSASSLVCCPQNDGKNGDWKQAIRNRVWELIDPRYADPPGQVHRGIPNFVGAYSACEQVTRLKAFWRASTVCISSEVSMRLLRFGTMKCMKTLFVPRYGLKAFMGMMNPEYMTERQMALAASETEGFRRIGELLTLDSKFKVDLVVMGSVAVDPISGARLGDGKGLRDLEYGILRHLGAIDATTPIVTVVHDVQLVNDIPVEKLESYDVPVDAICTPTQILRTDGKIPKPTGIYWDKVTYEKVQHIRVLQELKQKVEAETGKEVKLFPRTKRHKRRQKAPSVAPSVHNDAIFITDLPAYNTEEDLEFGLKDHLTKLGIPADGLTVFCRNRKRPTRKFFARLKIPDDIDFDACLNTIQNTDLRGCPITARRHVPPATYDPTI